MARSQRVFCIPLVVNVILLVLLALSCAGHPVAVPGESVNPKTNPATTSATVTEPAQARHQNVRTPITSGHHYFPNTLLHTQDNRTVRFYDDLLRGKVVMINFIFVTCGDICPLVTARLVQVQKVLGDRLGQDIFIYSITLDPQMDTPDVLKQYAEGYGTKPGWIFLTGKDEDIRMLRHKLGVYDRDPVLDADKTQHSGLIVYGNEATGKWAMTSGLLPPKRIAEAVLRVMEPQADAVTSSKP